MLNVQKRRITPAQLVIVVWFGAILLGFLLFMQCLYRPSIERMLDEKDRVEHLGDHLRWVTHTIDTYPDPQKVFDFFVASERSLSWRFPDAEQRSLLAISEYANKFQIRIEQIQPGGHEKVLSDRGHSLKLGGSACVGVPVSLKFKGGYQNLVKYLETLRKVLPAYMVVEKLQVYNNITTVPKLSGTIDLVLYLLE